MNVSTNLTAGFNINQNVKEEVSASRKEEVKALQDTYEESKAANLAQVLSSVQALVDTRSSGTSFEVQHQEFQTFLKDIGYDGKPIAELSQQEAASLVAEDGFFGVSQTSERIANFVIAGSGGDETLLREGKKGILQGFNEAEKMWGGKLPDISYETINKAVEMIDKALIDGGFSLIDESV